MLEPELARAKVNLALHVTGRREDGYHLLDTLVVFPAIGDVLSVSAADELALVVDGPGAADLADTAHEANLVMRAARGMAEIAGPRAFGVTIRLEKHLPVAAGLGGGSADAAATIRMLARLWDIDVADPRVEALALTLGADVPMCLHSRPLRARGIGEAVEPVEIAGDLGILIVNPRVPVPTPSVFRALARRDNPAMREPVGSGRSDLIAHLRDSRNDLEPAAIAVEPLVARLLQDLHGLEGRLLARMSGSGATCFALFEHAEAARDAGRRLAAERPDWWIRSAPLA
ncbi:4-(cytidine 5'-diphospho)-2-C-methyl-D-erythritol kinase [Chthonobacter albigriseus]|uniref:4-(cytidine 5'-diphospho)-2-C-methyl-D-erythritol kinase n=1 Tax=Chthonobacter albigriseus TaxID=1683161 RepID=UPI0015EF12CD|nr:4-(cytidine 5'-diphospho)-2-C-methyl-D-erythritol kinase [Chthonobacter albigriseus]